ncbi:MAG TPA: tetratricopeptide repeat protein [Desulfobacterales bacterium]
MSGSQKNTEAEDRGNGFPNDQEGQDAVTWNEDQVRQYLPEFCNLEIHTPEQELFASLDSDWPWETEDPPDTDTESQPDGWELPASSCESHSSSPGEDDIDSSADPITSADATAHGSGPTDEDAIEEYRNWNPDPETVPEADETFVNPESAAISWEYVDPDQTLTAGSTQQVHCLHTESVPEELPGHGEEGQPFEKSRPLHASLENSELSSDSAAEDESDFSDTDTGAAGPESESSMIPSESESALEASSAVPEPVASETSDAESAVSSSEVEDAGEAASEPLEPSATATPWAMPPGEVSQTAKTPLESSSLLEQTEAAAPSAASSADPSENAAPSEAEPVPLELTEMVAPGAAPLGTEPETEVSAEADSAPLELTEAVVSPDRPEDAGPVADENQASTDANFREGLKALFAGAVRATKEKDFPTAATCLERFVARSPNDYRGHYHLAVLYFRTGNYEAAQLSAEKAAALGAQGAEKLMKKISRATAATATAASKPPSQSPMTDERRLPEPGEVTTSDRAAIENATPEPPPKPEPAMEATSALGSGNTEGLPEFPTLFMDESGRSQTESAPAPKPEPAQRALDEALTAGGQEKRLDASSSISAEADPSAASNAALPENEPQAPVSSAPAAKALFARGMEASNRKDYETAAALFEEFITVSPEPAKGYYNLAILYYRLQNPFAARKYAELSVQNGVNAAGKILAKIDKHLKSSESVENVIKTGSGTEAQWVHKPAEASADVGESGKPDAEAVPPKAQVQAVSSDATPVVSPVGKGHDADSTGPVPEPAGAANEIVKTDGRTLTEEGPSTLTAEESNALFTQGMQASERKEYPTAIGLFEQFINANPQEPKGFFNLAILHYRLQDYASARQCAQKALDLGAETARAILQKIDRKTASKIEDPPKVAATPPDTPGGKPAPAEPEVEPALEENTDDLSGRFLQEMQQPRLSDPVVKTDSQSAEMLPEKEPNAGHPAPPIENKTGNTNIGAPEPPAAEVDESGKMAAAGKMKAAAAPLKPQAADRDGKKPAAKPAGVDKPEGLFARGMKASQRKDYKTAIQCFKRFVSLKPNEARGHHNLAILHYRLHDYDTARKFAQKAIELGLKSASTILASIDAKENKPAASAAAAPRQTTPEPASEPSSNTVQEADNAQNGSMELFDVQELDTEDFDTSAFLKNESIVWDADEMEDAFDGGQSAPPAEENEYSFEEDIIVFDSPKEDADPAAGNTTSSASSGDPAMEAGRSGKPGSQATVGTPSAPMPAKPGGAGNDGESDRCFQLGKEAIGRKDYLQAVKHFTRVAELNPNDPRAFFQLAVISFRMQYFETSREHAERALGLGYQPAQQLLETIQERAQAS